MTTLGLKRQRFAAWTLFFILVASLAPTVPSEAAKRLDSAKDAQWINDTFQEGKKYYEAGDYPAALKVWNTLDPYLDEYPSFKRVIDYLKNQIKGSPARPTKSAPSKNPAPSNAAVVSPESRIQSEMQTLQQEKVSRDYTDQKAWLKETFLKGKLAYATGDWTEAMMQWEKVIPYLDPTSQESLLIKKAKIEYENLKQARRQNESIVAERKAKLDAPIGFQETLIEATEKMKIEARELESRQQSLEKDAVFEEAWVNTTYEKGKEAYLQGRYDQAIEEWDKLIFKLGQQPELKESIEKMKQAHRQYKQSQIGYNTLTSAKAGAKHPASDGMQRFFAEAAEDLKERSETTFRDEKDMKNAFAQQQEQVNQIFLKGKLLHSQGKYKEALEEWQLLSSYFENDPALKSAFLSMQGSVSSYEIAKSSYQATGNTGAFRIKLPDNFLVTIQDASNKLSNQTREMEDKRSETEKAVETKRLDVTQTFDHGKKLYDAGKIQEAAAAWRKILPWVENSDDIQVMITQMEGNYATAQREQKALQQAQSKTTLSYIAPSDLTRLLESANENLRNQIQTAQSERLASDSLLTEKQSRLAAMIHKANIAYQSGKIQTALQEWSRMIPYLDPASEEKAIIQDLQENYAEWLKVRESQREVVQKGSIKVTLPEDLKKTLLLTNEKLIKETAEAKKSQSDIEAKLSGQEQQVRATYEKGRSLYLSGRIKEAIQEWKKINDFWVDATNVRVLLDQIEVNIDEQALGKKLLSDAQAVKEYRVAVPEELKKNLSALNEKLIKETAELKQTRDELVTKQTDRQGSAQSTFEKAHVYFLAGRYREAVDEWKKLSELWLDGAASRVLIEKFDATYQEKLYAEEALKIARSKQTEKFEAPEQLTQLLNEANVHVTQQIESTRAQQARMQGEVQQRFMQMDAIWKKGQDLLKQGKYREAVYEWDKLTIYLDEKSAIKPTLDTLKIQLQKMDQAKADTDKYIATEYREQRIPFAEDLGKLLMELNSKIQYQTDEAQKQRLGMEKTVSEKETWLKTTFEKGKTYYEVGKYKEAIEFWTSLEPVIKTNPELSSLMAGLKERFQNALKARKEADAVEARRNEKFPVPDELPQLLTSMNEKISSKQYEHMSRAEKAEQALQDRSATMTSIYMKGRSLYEANDYDGALKEWALLPGYLQDEPKIRVAVEQLQKSYQDLQNAQKQAAESEARQNIKFATPEGFTSLLSDAVFKLDKERQEVDLSKSHAEKILAEKQSAVQKIFVEGKNFYAQGKLNEAFLTWRGLAAQVEEGEEVEEALNKAETSYQSYVQAKDLNQQIVAKKEMKLSAPTELVELLRDANRTLTDQIFDAKNQSAQTNKMLADREKWIGTTFATGHLAYKQGRYRDAVTEWNTLLPFIENGSDLKKALTDFERNLEVSMQSSKILEEAAVKKEIKFAAPEELGVLLMELNEKVKNEAFEASAEKIKAEQSTSEKRKWITDTFELGKQFYQQGKFDKAMDEWTKLSPYLEASSGVQKLIDAVKENYAASLEAKKSAVQAAANDYTGLKLPYAQSMTKLLTEADEKLKQDTESYRAKQENMKRTMAEREEWSVTTFNKGKVYYDQGDYDQALGQWERLVPYLEAGSDIKEKIESLRENFNTLLAGKEALGDPTQERPVKLEKADTMLAILEEANQKLKGEAKEILSKSDEASRSLRQRKEWIEYNFNKGKTFYDQGNFAKAVEEWSILQPYLGEHPEIRSQIEELKNGFKEGKLAEKVIKEMDEKKKALIPLPEYIEVSSTEPQIPPVVRVPPSQGDPATSFDAPLQLVSGEIVSIDEPQRTLTLKHFSDSGVEETLTVNFDAATKLDGQAVQSLSTIQSGTEIDLRYNPQTSHALYIYVY